jgi:hypothetical protein
MKTAFIDAQAMAREEKKTVDLNSKFTLPVFDNRAQTGTSIAQGNYINLQPLN